MRADDVRSPSEHVLQLRAVLGLHDLAEGELRILRLDRVESGYDRAERVRLHLLLRQLPRRKPREAAEVRVARGVDEEPAPDAAKPRLVRDDRGDDVSGPVAFRGGEARVQERRDARLARDVFVEEELESRDVQRRAARGVVVALLHARLTAADELALDLVGESANDLRLPVG